MTGYSARRDAGRVKGATMDVYEESRDEELARLRRELSECDYDSPEYGLILDRIAVLVREAAVARRVAS